MNRVIFILTILPFPIFAQWEDTAFVVGKVNVECGIRDTCYYYIGSTIERLEKGSNIMVLQKLKNPSKQDFYMVVGRKRRVGYISTDFVDIDSAGHHLLSAKNKPLDHNYAFYFLDNNLETWLKEEAKQKEKDLLSIQKKLLKYKILITRNFLSKDYDFQYPAFHVTFTNCSYKTIKYVWFNITAYNAVDDVVEKNSLKGIGPIKPFEEGSYNFDNAIHTKVANYHKINNVKIQYMDGSVVAVDGKSLTIIKDNY